jgi:molecular chaperone DnaK
MAQYNKSLGRFILDGIPPAPRGVPQVEVTFDIDANGIVNVSAKDKGTGREQKITITASSGLAKDEVERMVKESEQYAAEDAKRKEEVETRNNADSLAYQAERLIKDTGDKLSAEDKTQIESHIQDVRSALGTDDLERIKTAVTTLTETMHAASQKMYAQAGAETPPNGNGEEPPTTGEENTVEGEFKEV